MGTEWITEKEDVIYFMVKFLANWVKIVKMKTALGATKGMSLSLQRGRGGLMASPAYSLISGNPALFTTQS